MKYVDFYYANTYIEDFENFVSSIDVSDITFYTDRVTVWYK